MSVVALAQAIGTTRQHVYMVETGKNGMTVDRIMLAAKALQCEPSELIVKPRGKRRTA